VAKKKLIDDNLLAAFLSKSSENASKRKNVKESKRVSGKKVKLTIYVSEESDRDIEELRLLLREKEGKRITKSEVVERAIAILKSRLKKG